MDCAALFRIQQLSHAWRRFWLRRGGIAEHFSFWGAQSIRKSSEPDFVAWGLLMRREKSGLRPSSVNSARDAFGRLFCRLV